MVYVGTGIGDAYEGNRLLESKHRGASGIRSEP